MSGVPLLSAIGLGFVLGLQHATDPDHLVAVATIVTRERRLRDGARIGILWGLGHSVTLLVAGGLLVSFDVVMDARLSDGLELAVAAMIVLLGALRLREALRGLHGVPAGHVLADHDHDGREAFHSHAHDHESASHAHPHVHPSRRLLAALAGGRGIAWRALFIGMIHGLAGTAALSLLVLSTIHSALAGLAYLLVFGVGTIAGMTALTAVMAYPVTLALRFRRTYRALSFCAGAGAIVFGLVYAIRLL